MNCKHEMDLEEKEIHVKVLMLTFGLFGITRIVKRVMLEEMINAHKRMAN